MSQHGESSWSKAWFWFSQVMSVIGLASILDDLKLWMLGVHWVIAKINLVMPWLAAALIDLGALLHKIVSAWRHLIHPLIDFLLRWLPFTVPVVVKDLLLVAVFVGLGWWRTDESWTRPWRRQNNIIEKIGKRLGVDARSISEIRSHTVANFNYYNDPKSYGYNHGHKYVERLKAALGKHFDAFMHEIKMSSEFWEAEDARNWARRTETPLKTFIFAAAGFVLVLVAIDWWLWTEGM